MRKVGIDGKDANAERAHSFLPPNTSNVRNASIYVEKTADGLYFHSNFVTPGFENPTKILTSETDNLKLVFSNLIFGDDASSEEKLLALGAFKNNLHIYLDRSMFSQGGYPIVDIGDVAHVAIVDGGRG